MTTGKELKPVTIDGVSCRHFFFTQSPGMELELWLENTEQAILAAPTDRDLSLAAGPTEFHRRVLGLEFERASGWVAAFTFQPAAGSTKIELEPAGAGRNK